MADKESSMPDKVTCPKVTVEWSIEVNCTCPHCDHYFDLLSVDGDFWECLTGFEAGESVSDMNIDWECPECKKEFTIDKLVH